MKNPKIYTGESLTQTKTPVKHKQVNENVKIIKPGWCLWRRKCKWYSASYQIHKDLKTESAPYWAVAQVPDTLSPAGGLLNEGGNQQQGVKWGKVSNTHHIPSILWPSNHHCFPCTSGLALL